jgi:hypothetical protein
LATLRMVGSSDVIGNGTGWVTHRRRRLDGCCPPVGERGKVQ